MDYSITCDDLNRIRLMKPEVTESSNKLIAQSEEFFKNYEEFRGSVNGVRETVEQVGRVADGERLKLLSLQAELSQPSGPVDEDKQQLNILINEKNRELDQLKFELQSLKMLEAQQSEFLLMCKRM